ncbi:uncharacterized protein FIBRA_04975 [Fibroporia radiculosa]|uniref:Uncharacterized protein n=1 Tax=Fibroporia radiculosa TaxID=599839 RepID=J4G897_9APHY|nr:uncharacterized protein FIBRA_04975 [Fibroporia radiculosa]CCM02863.1 predicted protein [Fibroporia radiculosa]
MPNVFVIPPEEEQEENPPWCYFDASEAAQGAHATEPDIEALDTALHFHQQVDNRAPAFHRSLQNDSQDTVVLPRRGSLTYVREAAMTGAEEDVKRKTFDEEIVEVVKVRRNEGRENISKPQADTIKKSKTFKARATQAFKSIKNVGKGVRPPVSSVSASTCVSGENARVSEDARFRETLPRPSSPNLTRRRSLVLSQLFTFSNSSRPMSAEPDSPTSPVASSSSTLPLRHSMQTLPSATSPLKSQSQSHARRLHPSPSLEDCADPPSHSTGDHSLPKSSLSKRKSFRKRISVLELQKLFSVSNPPASATSVQDSRSSIADTFATAESDPHTLPSSRSSSSASSISSYAYVSEDLSPPFELDACISDPDLEEMRLDSLHFDSLHFDPEDF